MTEPEQDQVTYTTPLAQAQADLYVAADAVSLSLQRWPLDEENSKRLRRMNEALWAVKSALESNTDRHFIGDSEPR